VVLQNRELKKNPKGSSTSEWFFKVLKLTSGSSEPRVEEEPEGFFDQRVVQHAY
jgi:hypothetical protein